MNIHRPRLFINIRHYFTYFIFMVSMINGQRCSFIDLIIIVATVLTTLRLYKTTTFSITKSN
ncbi:hypothetical protein C0J52_07482 [Blattella germanica]|nr:hypothetical protein C0J52_07482 [Blattella germanica]